MEEENTLDISLTDENVKSTAIVKYSVPKPAQFNKLQCNTDLNLPPSNWLSSSADSYGLQHALSNQKGFSSFRMAHLFPDCVGEVDVVSDAENIKKLLKIPYHKGHISMMVHRIDNTLLIDDFDIYKHLLRTAESEWEWLRKFFFEHINAESYEEDKNRYIKSRTREALKQKSLVSKFLYHSLVQNELSEADPGTVDVDFKYKSPLPVQGPPLPDPTTSSASPDSSNFEHQYNRNVVWTFEDIEMLLGTDMPIFGGGTYPCISLRLHDMNKPINVLTGIDYWLDNLMSNVPEVVMCYHLNGIVQRYELIKTEDLPRLDNSKFSPKLIRDVAQSILSFLKSNATKAGHTYWLFKGKDEEVVKLYDLSSLCSQDDAENVQHNPFTVPVAMLLYRVARNMMHSGDRRRPGTIRILLQNCVKLLQEDKYPEIVTSSHYMLSELYVPAGTNPESPDMVEAMEVDDEETLYDDDLPSECDNVKMLDLEQEASDKFVKNYKPPPPISGSVEERCLQAIQHITSGLNCLKYFPEQKKDVKEENINQANPMEPIPMPYSSLSNNVDVKEKKTGSKKHKEKKNKSNSNSKKEESENALLLKQKNEAQSLPTWQFQNGEVKWKEHLKTLLYEKALLVYATLSEYYFTSKNYGSSLRNLAILVRIQQIMNVLTRHSNVLRENCLLGRTGDCCVMIVQNWSKCEIYREELQSNLDEDFKMMEQLERDEQIYNVRLGECNLKCVFIYDIRTVEQILFKAVECYEEALKISEDDNNMLKRFGNSLNEIANYYLNEAKTCKTSASITEVAKKAETYLIRGLEVLERIKDDANVALLYSNMGHLHRLLAYASTPPDRGELQPLEKLHLNKAIVNYKKALTCLGERKDSPEIWDAVKWELSTTLFNMASIMHENPPSSLSKLEAEKGVIEVLQKALTYCDLDEANPKFPLYQYRAAVIYYRIGSLYHNHIWSNNKDLGNRKHIIQLAKINYEKASKLNFLSEDALSYFTSQMQRVALSEYLGETATTSKNKIQHLTHCLDIILESREMIMLLVKKEVDIPEEQLQNNNKDEFKTLYSLLDLVRVRLQHNLKNLIKLCSVKPAPVKDSEKFTELYKNAFKITFKLKEGLAYSDLVQNLNLVLKDISNLLE